MSWTSSLLVGALTGAIGLVASGFIANACVAWYRISGVDLQSTAFVASISILGGFVAFLIGLVTSRVMPDASFLKALGSASGIVLLVGGVSAGTARLLADVPPTIDGEALTLAVELRWPASRTTPVSIPGEPTLVLGSVTRMSHTQRAQSTGPLWMADAKLVDGRWVAPGAVDIFTTRGKLTLSALLDSANNPGFLLPLSGKPSKSDFEWTEWYPHARAGAPPLPDGFQYRYRVQKRSEPVRAETIGPFEISTIASYFFDETLQGKTRLATMGYFTVKYRSRQITVPSQDADSAGAQTSKIDELATIPGSQTALLAHFYTSPSNGACYLLIDRPNDGLKIELVPGCVSPFAARPLTSDTTTFRQGAERRVPRGRIDRLAFEKPGLYVLANAVLDSRRLLVRTIELPDDFTLVPSVPPLGVSPDERSFARFGYGEHRSENPVILVTDVVANQRYTVPIDPKRMRYAKLEVLDPAWLTHHFEWRRGAGGADALFERKDFVPIPYRGQLTLNKDWNEYRLEPAGEGLRQAILEFLVAEFNGTRTEMDASAYQIPVTIDGHKVNVANGSSFDYVSISLDHGDTNLVLLETIAKRFDAALATGKYDSLFGK